MTEQESQQQQPCVICNQIHEQMLMLSCEHDPCITCAAKHFVETEPEDSNVYSCSRCGEETQLDHSSIVQLRKIYNAIKRRKKMERNHTTASPTPPTKTSPLTELKNRKNQYQPLQIKKPVIPPTQTYTASNKKGNYVHNYSCKDHPDEDLTYFCFSCSKPICPECAIHGSHKDHQVQTTRKAIKQIRTLLTQDKAKLDGKAKVLLQTRERGKREAKALIEQNRGQQEYIKKKVTHLRNVLAEKEKELLRAAESALQRNLDRVKHEETNADCALSEIMAIHRNIDVCLKKEDLAILQEFSSRDEQVAEMLDKAEASQEAVQDYLEQNSQISINLNLLDEGIDQLSSQIYDFKLAMCVGKLHN